MTRLVWLTTIIAVLATACAGAAAPSAPTQAPAAGFRATDPATVELAAGQPQLIKFYAEW